MDEYLTILTTGGAIALFALFVAFFLFPSCGGGYKKSLFRMTALFYFILLLWNLIFVVAMLFFPHLLMDWKLSLMFNLPLLPFITFIIKEMLYADKCVDGKTIFQHTAIPVTLFAAYLLTRKMAPTFSVWFFWGIVVWAIVYVGIFLPLAIVRIRRYNALVREIFVDSEGRSLVWLARLSCTLFILYVAYAVFSLFNLNFLTTWVFNVFEFVVYLIFGLQISRMRYSNLIRLDQPEIEMDESLNQSVQMEDAILDTDDSKAAKFVTELEQWLKADNRLSSNDLNREMVARAMCTNHVTLARTLRRQTGMTLAQFVTDLRLREAERLLLNTNLSIEEIYSQVGYQTRSTFSRAFQGRNNCTATEWREQHQKKNNNI